MWQITHVHARQIFDSRGFPTVEVDLEINHNTWGRGIAPSGASTGQFEALERRDNDATCFRGKGVLKVCNAINGPIKAQLVGRQFAHSFEVDQELTQTATESLGSNGLLAISIASANAIARAQKQTLAAYLAEKITWAQPCIPTPFLNMINGGAHAHNNLSIQEFMLVPQMAGTLAERLKHAAHVAYMLKDTLKQQGFATNVGDEGGFAPPFESTTQALDTLMEAIEKAGYKPVQDFALAMDVAANECVEGDGYRIDGTLYSTDELINQYGAWLKQYPIISIEDGLRDDDASGWERMTAQLPNTQWVGDDLFVTQKERLLAMPQAANAILLKPNQVGTLWGTLQTWQTACSLGYKGMASHRSGETEDVTIAHVAVATGCGQIKTGALARTDRTAKYNELLRLEETLKNG